MSDSFEIQVAALTQTARIIERTSPIPSGGIHRWFRSTLAKTGAGEGTDPGTG